MQEIAIFARRKAAPVVLTALHKWDQARPGTDSRGEGGTSRWARIKEQVVHAYDLLRNRFDYQERICAAFRHADRLQVLHGLRSDEDVRETLEQFLKIRYRKHRRWLAIDGTLALFGSLLTPFPGPNIFFFYPAARALSHFLAVRGINTIRRLRQSGMVAFEPDPLITRVNSQMDSLDELQPEIEQLEQRYHLTNVHNLLAGR